MVKCDFCVKPCNNNWCAAKIKQKEKIDKGIKKLKQILNNPEMKKAMNSVMQDLLVFGIVMPYTSQYFYDVMIKTRK